MGLLFKLALRNLARNLRRTLLSCLLIGCSLAALMLTDGLILGMVATMTDSVTRTLAGEAQVHRKGFLDTLDAKLYLDDLDRIQGQLEASPEVLSYSARTLAPGMIASTSDMTGAMVYGVDPAAEAGVSRLAEAVVEGRYLSLDSEDILLGAPLAERLDLQLGDRVVVTQSRIGDGEISQALFRLSGIFRFGMRELDENLAFVSLEAGRALLDLPHGAHEVALRLRDPADANRDLPLYRRLANERDEARGWLAVNPQFGTILEMVDYSTLIIGVVLFIVASLGIVNSLFMSIYERIYEFGVVRALGTRPGLLAALILLEAALLALAGIAFGLLLGGVALWWGQAHGVPLGQIEFEGISFADRIRTVVRPDQFTLFPLWVLVLTVVTALYPARFAARLVPARALQRAL